jgi:glycopeptide antibiotics resistance protein
MTVAPTPHLRRIGAVLAVTSLAAIGFATLMPEPPARTGSHLCLLCGSLGVVNAVLNVFLFVPIGVGLALYGVEWKRAVIFACAISTAIEITQFLAIPGRYSTVGDVITNSLGGALGFALGRYAETLLRPSAKTATRLLVGWAVVWLAVQLVSSYGFAISLPDSQYYGQIARRLGSFDVFRGRVLSATVGSLPIPNTLLGDSHAVRQALLGGAKIATAVTPASPTNGIAPIVRVADNRGREIALIAQRGRDVVFGVHTGASVLKVRTPLFAVRDVFPPQPVLSPDTVGIVSIRGSYLSRGAELETERSGSRRVTQLPFRASLAWTFWLPFEWLISGTRAEWIVSFIWLMVLSLPLGYWFFPSGLPWNLGVGRIPIAIFVAAVLGFGLFVIPMLFGLALGSTSDCFACLIGFGAGALLPSRRIPRPGEPS